MSKITFRAADDLIEELETFEASKSEVMRRALRQFLDAHPQTDVDPSTSADTAEDSLDELVADRLDAMIETRLEGAAGARPQPRDVNVNITLDGDSVTANTAEEPERKTVDEASDTAGSGRNTCGQCGERVGAEHVYCPNCGEKISHRVFCECGDELRSDWGYCPSCGRRTPAADVLDST